MLTTEQDGDGDHHSHRHQHEHLELKPSIRHELSDAPEAIDEDDVSASAWPSTWPDEQFSHWMCTLPDIALGLRSLRAMQGLTLQEVADLAGLHPAYVDRLEHGERMPERDTLIALLLAAFSLPVPRANRLLLLAGFAPLHHRSLARRSRPRDTTAKTRETKTRRVPRTPQRATN